MRFLLIFCLSLSAALAGETKVTVLATTDMHGNLYPYDYFTSKPADRGLVKVATLIAEARRQAPAAMLIDCGDTIQGSPVETVYQQWVKYGRLPLGLTSPTPLEHDPMMLAMNHLRYDAMVVGNHEFNFGLKNLNSARSDAAFPWLSATIRTTPGSTAKPFAPYLLKTIDGVKVAIVGITTPAIPTWEQPDHYTGYTFQDGADAAAETVRELRASEHPDLIIFAVHAGLERDLKTGQPTSGDYENMVYRIATRLGSGPDGIDAIVFGHSHQVLPETRVNGVLLIQPKNWAGSLARLDFTLDGEPGHWKLRESHGTLLPVESGTPADPEILALAKPYHDLTERYLATRVADSPVEMSGRNARFEDSALIDAIQQVQLHYTKADVSLTALFNPRVFIARGAVTVRELAALYVYDNELFAIEGTGRMVRLALENAARFFQSCRTPACEGPLVNSKVMGYNFDMAEGVEYEIDLSRPEGDRIRNLRLHGRPLADDQPLRIATNNYRAGGSGGYTMFRGAKVVWKSPEAIRDLMIEYYGEHKLLPARASGNWRIVPEAAVRTLESGSQR